MNTFAERLKYAMEQADLKQSALSEQAGISKAAISQYLSGKNTPNQERIKALADVTGVPPVKKVIFSGPKTIVLWADGTKTIVSCGAGDTYDYYAGFCAAVVKKLFGSTTHAKKVLGEVVQVK